MGFFLGRKEDGSLALLDLSIIGNWMRSSLFSIPFKESKLLSRLDVFQGDKNLNFSVKLLFKAMDRSENVLFPYKS